MNDDDNWDLMKSHLKNIETYADIRNNPVVVAGRSSLKSIIPFFGDLIDHSMESAFQEYQMSKRNEFIDYIMSSDKLITKDQVADIEFIMNLLKSIDLVNRLAKNDKVKYFGNLLKNGYLNNQLQRIDSDEFDEYFEILSELSAREIEYLVFIWGNTKNHNGKIVNDDWSHLKRAFETVNSGKKIEPVLRRLSRTGFVSAVSSDDKQTEGTLMLGSHFCGYAFEPEFRDFATYVLEIES